MRAARTALLDALREEGCAVEAFEEADGALAAIAKSKPEVVFVGPVDPAMIDFLARLEQTMPEQRPHVALVLDAESFEHPDPKELREFVREWIGTRPTDGDRPSTTAIRFSPATR
jgi:hypothetical protein